MRYSRKYSWLRNLYGLRGLLLWCFLIPCANLSAEEDSIEVVVQAREAAALGNYQEAFTLASSVSNRLVSQFGVDHVYHAYLLDDLSRYSSAIGRSKSAIKFSEQALDILSKTANASLSDRLNFMHNLGAAYSADGQIEPAIFIFDQVRAGRVEENNVNEQIGVSIILGELLLEDRQLQKARSLLIEAQSQSKDTKGVRATEYIETTLALSKAYLFLEDYESSSFELNSLIAMLDSTAPDLVRSKIYVMQARVEIQKSNLARASQLLAEAERMLVSSPTNYITEIGAILYNRAKISMLQGDALTAEAQFQQALNNYLERLDSTHPAVLRSLQGLGLAMNYIGDFKSASDILGSVAENFEIRFGSDHVVLGESLTEWSRTLIDAGETEKAVVVATRAESLYANSLRAAPYNKATAASALGFALAAHGEKAAAIVSFERAVSGFVSVRGEESSDLPPGYMKLAELYMDRGDVSTAKNYIAKAKYIINKDASSTPLKKGALSALEARAAGMEGKCSFVAKIVSVGLEAIATYVTNSSKRSNISRMSVNGDRQVVENLLRELVLCLDVPHLNNDIKNNILLGVQLPQLQSTAAAITQLNEKYNISNIGLRDLLNQRKKISFKTSKLEGEIKQALASDGVQDKYQDLTMEIATLQDKLIQLNTEIRAIDPEYASYAMPAPVGVAQIQELLRKGEAVLIVSSASYGTVSVLISQNDLNVASSDLERKDLANMVANLRDQLDVGLFPESPAVPDFDTRGAHRLYTNILEPFRARLEGIDHLIVVADGPLQRIPFSIFLTELPDGEIQRFSDYSLLAYLARQYSISYLPSLGSLAVLRSVTATDSDQSSKRFVGFGDPIVPHMEENDAGAAQVLRRGSGGIQVHSELLKDLYVRLPESAEELKSISKMFAPEHVDLYLREDATRENVMNAEFDNIEVLAFATHGIMANELSPIFTEPGLLLSPPIDDMSEIDLFLTTSDIASLNIDAELVLLSACNTAAPSSEEIGAEGLSGLARSFFYAGARSLLVSHWYVETKSAQQITTGTMEGYLKDSLSVNRKAIALNSVMLDFIDGEYGRIRTHPAFWAPFVLVGDG